MTLPDAILAEEVTRLRTCLNDLVSIMALPALWAESEPRQIARTLQDALLEMLDLVFVIVRVNERADGAPIEMIRVGDSPRDATDPEREREVRELLATWGVAESSDASRRQPARRRAFVGDGDVSVATASIGLGGELGGLVVGARRRDFPTQAERLILDVAANQAAIGLQHARSLKEQKRITTELDERVAQRTRELAAASEALHELHAEMARAAQVATVAELAASIAHEVTQPLSGIITNAGTCVRMLNADPPNVDGARETARRTIRDGNRASDVITRLRALFGKRELALEPVDLNEATREVIALSSIELQRNHVVLRLELDDDVPPIIGDRVQLQQVIVNLVRNASEAMTTVDDRARELLVRTEPDGDDRARLTVRDSGVGVGAESVSKLFDPFYTTKPDGMGIGLSVSRSIIERHHGRLWAEPNDGAGATFAFSIPCRPGDTKG